MPDTTTSNTSADNDTSGTSDTSEPGDEMFDPLNRGRAFYRTDDHVGGVAGGIAEYLDIDPSLARIGAAALLISTGPAAVAAYVAGWLFLPDASGSSVIGNPTPQKDTQ